MCSPGCSWAQWDVPTPNLPRLYISSTADSERTDVTRPFSLPRIHPRGRRVDNTDHASSRFTNIPARAVERSSTCAERLRCCVTGRATLPDGDVQVLRPTATRRSLCPNSREAGPHGRCTQKLTDLLCRPLQLWFHACVLRTDLHPPDSL